MTWAFPTDEEREEKHTRVTFEIDPISEVVRLTVTYDHLEHDSEMLEGITKGWPKVLSSLKSLMEWGKPLPDLDKSRPVFEFDKNYPCTLEYAHSRVFSDVNKNTYPVNGTLQTRCVPGAYTASRPAIRIEDTEKVLCIVGSFLYSFFISLLQMFLQE